LQQNAFDDVDQATPIDRQVKDFNLVYRALSAPLRFEAKGDARRFFARLQDAFYQKNYTREGSAEHQGYLETIEKLLAEGSAA
jgi:V/A-type H+-transporting ATPase subunit A